MIVLLQLVKPIRPGKRNQKNSVAQSWLFSMNSEYLFSSHLWTHGNWYSVCQDIYTFEHLCPDICTKTNIFGHKPPLNKIGTRLDESGKSVHLAGLDCMFLYRLEVLLCVRYFSRYFQLLSNLTWNKQAVWRPNVLKGFCK